MNNTSITQIKINSCRTTQARQTNNRYKHWITIVRNKRKIWWSTYSGSYENKVMEPSVKKSASGHLSALPRNLIHRHPCRSSDRRRRLRDTVLPRSAARRMKERQCKKQRCRKRVGLVEHAFLEYRTSAIYRGLWWNCPDSIWQNPRNCPWNLSTCNWSEPTYVNAPAPPTTQSWRDSLGVIELTN
jgi:hypothetical protein